jgi:site-specific recombinase XerD
MTAFQKAEALAGQRYDRDKLLAVIDEVTTHFRMPNSFERSKMRAVCRYLADALDRCSGSTLQQRWNDLEKRFWPKWKAGVDRRGREYWTWGARVLISARMIAPSLDMLSDLRVNQWIAHLPEDHPLAQQHTSLLQATDSITWTSAHSRQLAVSNGLRILLVRGYSNLHHIKDDDLKLLSVRWSKGTDALDAALCTLGVFSRTPKRGSARHGRRRRMTAPELVQNAGVPDRFRQIMILYLETYEARVSDVYRTLRHKVIALSHFWRFIQERHPDVQRCSQILPRHVRDYIPHVIARARAVQRGPGAGDEVRPTAHSWLVDLRVFFSDLCAWATEPDSPFKRFAPRTIPATRHTFLGYGFDKARERTQARITATVLDLEREMPKIRAFALQRWKAAVAAPKVSTTRGYPWSDEVDTFWDWALLELLVQSGLRIEEASELTTLDILKRKMPDARIYYLLHIKPSKFDRARVIPIGDGLGRVLAEIIRYVKCFYNSESVPVCDHWDLQEKRPRPPAPYLIQGIRHPSTAGIQTIRSRIREISIDAGARRSNGSPLVLLPHDCRRVFASEHLNNNTPVHIIQALLGHASPDTVMIYAKLYPSQLIEEYRKTVRSLYNAYYGEDGLKNPTAEEWAAFAANCNLRDMGTHLCALPTGEHCPKGLICLGCAHAQPKKSAVPIFRRMLASHERSLVAARGHSEPAGQIAAREMEIVRITGALRRAEDLNDDVAAAIEGTL